VVGSFHQMILDRVGQGVDDLGEDIIGANQLDDGAVLGRPQVLPATAQAVLVLGQQLVKTLEELGEAALYVPEDGMIVVAVGDEGDELDAGAAGGVPETVEEGVVRLTVGAQEELPLSTATSDEVHATSHNLPRLRHGRRYRLARQRVDWKINLGRGLGGEWEKVSSETYKFPDGTWVEVHGYRNRSTGETVEPKSKTGTWSP
jgi:hypothetical protein